MVRKVKIVDCETGETMAETEIFHCKDGYGDIVTIGEELGFKSWKRDIADWFRRL